MSTNPGPSSQSTVNDFNLDTNNFTYPLALAVHNAAHAAMGNTIMPVVYGDGVSDDTQGLLAAITAAGVNGTITLPFNKTILISNTITFLAGQRIVWNNSTFKRDDQIYTTLKTGSIIAGTTTSAIVNNASRFNVGDYISVTEKDMNTAAGTAAYNHYTVPVQITRKSGNTLFFAAPGLGAASTADVDDYLKTGTAEAVWTFDSATTVSPFGILIVKVYDLIHVSDNCVLIKPIINGNWKDDSGNLKQIGGCNWDVFTDMHVLATIANTRGIEIHEPTIYNFASDAIIEGGGDGTTSSAWAGLDYNVKYLCPLIKDGAGNGIHHSAINNPLVYFPEIHRCNQDVSVGHVGGGICLSFIGQHLSVQGGNITRCWTGMGASGVSGAYIALHSNIRFNNVTVEDTFWRGFNAYGSSVPENAGIPQNIQVSGCTFKNASIIGFGNTSSRTASQYLDGIQFFNNLLIGTGLRFYQANGQVMGNKIFNDYVIPTTISAYGTTTFNGSTVSTATVASTTGLYKGQLVFIGLKGNRSNNLYIVDISGSTVTFNALISPTIATGAYLYNATKVSMVQQTLTVAITSGVTNTLTLPDATLFNINDYLVVGEIATIGNNTADVNSASAVRIRDINYSTGVIILSGTLNQTYAIGKVVQFWRGFDCDFGASIYADTCQVQILNNEVIGCNHNIEIANAVTGLAVIGNHCKGARQVGIQGSSASTNVEKYSSNICEATSYSASFWQGFFLRSKVDCSDNTILTNAAGQTGVQCTGGDHGILNGFKIHGAATISINITAGASNTHMDYNYGTGSFTNSATGSPSSTGNVTIA